MRPHDPFSSLWPDWLNAYKDHLCSHPHVLNALRTWLTIEEHSVLFRRLSNQLDVTALQLRALGVPDGSTVARPKPRLRTPSLADPVLDENPSARAEQVWKWIQCLEESHCAQQSKDALRFWLEGDRRRSDDYLLLTARWSSFMRHRADHVVTGLLTPAVPMMSAINLPTFERLAQAEGELARQLRRMRRLAILPEWKSLRSSAEGLSLLYPTGGAVNGKLDAHSEVEVFVSASQRRVRLLKGEILLNVFNEPGWPFELLVDELCLTPLATRGSVCRVETGGIHVCLYEGYLKVERPGGSIADVEGPLQLSGHQQTFVSSESCIVQHLHGPDIKRLEAWLR